LTIKSYETATIQALKTVHSLICMMRVIPVCSRWLSNETICEFLTRSDWTLSDVGRSVHVIVVALMKTMPVDGQRFAFQHVPHSNHHLTIHHHHLFISLCSLSPTRQTLMVRHFCKITDHRSVFSRLRLESIYLLIVICCFSSLFVLKAVAVLKGGKGACPCESSGPAPPPLLNWLQDSKITQ